MADLPKIVGLSGTNGSGKDTTGELLSTRFGYKFISVTDLLRAELKKRGLDVTRKNLRGLSSEWRREAGNLGVLVDKALAEFETSSEEFNGLAVASLRNPGEATRVHELGGIVIWLDADPLVRYERVTKNAHERGRGSEDNVSFEEFKKQEAAEMISQNASDSSLLNMTKVKEMSDVFIDNSSDTEALAQAIETALK